MFLFLQNSIILQINVQLLGPIHVSVQIPSTNLKSISKQCRIKYSQEIYIFFPKNIPSDIVRQNATKYLDGGKISSAKINGFFYQFPYLLKIFHRHLKFCRLKKKKKNRKKASSSSQRHFAADVILAPVNITFIIMIH